MSTPISGEIKEKKIRGLMLKSSSIVSYSKEPMFKRKKNGTDHYSALPVLLNIDAWTLLCYILKYS